MNLTSEQRNAVRENSHTLVKACAGSGKTRTLVAKLLRCADEFRESPRRVACITYTNTAVHEVEQRFRLYATDEAEARVEITTIHSFCLNAILNHFYWRLPEYREGFEIAPSDGDVFRETAFQVADEFGLQHRKTLDALQNATRLPDGTPLVGEDISPAAAIRFWELLREDWFLDFSSIVYLSYRLLADNPSLLHGLSCRYAWILVDEFQDTTELQVALLQLLASRKKTRFFLVGDPKQSIFGFAGARPELMDEFGAAIDAVHDYPLTGNYRCSERIVANAESLISNVPPMRAVGDDSSFSFEPCVIHCERAFDGLTDHFLPAIEALGIPFGSAAVLAPWWVKLLHLGRDLREYQIPVFGPGARPYKRSSHLIAGLAEQLCAQIQRPRPERIRQIERELFSLVSHASGRPDFRLFRYETRVLLFGLLRFAAALRGETESGIVWIQGISDRVAEVLSREGLIPEEAAVRVRESAAGMTADMVKNGVDVENMRVEDLGLFADPRDSVKLMTFHRAKGREFDAVALVDVHEGRFPHYLASTQEEIDESRRLLYVGITRARKVLYYITDDEDSRNGPSRFLSDTGAI